MEEKIKQEPSDEEDDESRSQEEADGQSPAPDKNASEDGDPGPYVKPVERKIGESGDNLRRRENWFRRRAGKD